MKAFFTKSWAYLKTFLSHFSPGERTTKRSYKAVAATAVVLWLIVSIAVFVVLPNTWFGIGAVILGLAAAFLVSAGSVLVHMFLKSLPERFFWFVPGAFFLLSFLFNDSVLSWQFPLLALTFATLTGAGLSLFLSKERNKLNLLQRGIKGTSLLIGLSGLIWGLIWVLDSGDLPDTPPINAALHGEYRPESIDLPNPGDFGDHEIDSLTYGSGIDKHRKAFGADVQLTTDPVDGSDLIDNWDNFSGKLRKWYWGFGQDELPLNGRVWFPKGDGPFPLALIVHGNHSMYDFSDPGYAYLGELLASQGIIMVSVDENFINGGWPDFFGSGLKEENDARGWLLLEHLKQWKSWNQNPDHPFYDKVDFDNLAVMGHSRGGEAAAIAAFFNNLHYYPDNADVIFDYHFNIKSVVAIAPVDGQYKPGETGTPLKNVNYLVLHGANDGDVQAFQGLRQYQRLSFDDQMDYFKTNVYIYGANHGQFNTTWGNKDNMFPMSILLNTKALMPFDEQLQISKTYISAFLQTTLLGKTGYRDFFKDYRKGLKWLPETIYLQQYQDASWQTLADYEEDLDLTTSSQTGLIKSKNLTVWREQVVQLKYGNLGNRAVYLGWDSLAHQGAEASYHIQFPQALNLQNHPVLTFDLAEAKENSYPNEKKDENENEVEEENNLDDSLNESENINDEENAEKKRDNDNSKPNPPIDLTIQLKDSLGQTLAIPLSQFSYLQRQIEVDVLKNPSLQSTKTSEPIFQTFFFNLSDARLRQKDFLFNAVHEISLIFNQTKQGVIVLDQLAIH